MPIRDRITKGQRAFLEAIFDDCGGVFHRRVVQPLFDAGYVWPKAGNFLFWIVGCMGHGANEFVLAPEGYDALVGQLPLPL